MPLDRGSLSWQEYGSAITYARRYALVAILGVASEEDDDGNAASGNTAKTRGKPKADASSQREKDLRAAHAIKDKLLGGGLPPEQFDENVVNLYGTASMADLTDEDLHKLVGTLRAAEREHEQRQADRPVS